MTLPKRQPCTNCDTTDPKGQWWFLANYYGVSGSFCPECYDKVSHNPYGNPNRPDDYQAILEKQQKGRNQK